MHAGARTHRWAVIALLLAVVLAGTGTARAVVPQAPAQQGPTCAWQSIGNASRAVYYAAAAMDTDKHHLYVYGGLDPSLESQDVVQRIDLSGATITSAPHTVLTGLGPAKRFGAAGAYRSKGADSAIYFIGGSGDVRNGNGTSDVQVYRVAADQWTSLATTGVFEDRFFHAAAYDPLHDVIWVTGGIGRCGLDDIAADRCLARSMATKYLRFDPTTGAATWQTAGGTGGPTAVYGHSMAFDAVGKRLVALGGTRDGGQGSNDLWQLDLSDPDPANARWSDLNPLGIAFPRVALHAAAVDAGRLWLVAYGGVTTNFNTPSENIPTTAYALDLGLKPPVWSNLGASLQQRVGAVMAYDDLHHAVVLTGGRRASKASPPQSVERDTSALICSDQPTQLPPPATSMGTGTSLPPPVTSVPTVTPGGPTPTSILPPPITPGPTGVPGIAQTCKFVQRFGRVPAQAIADALANPGHVFGWQVRCNPSVPSSAANRPRIYLSLHAINKPYHPLWNPLEYKCGCP